MMEDAVCARAELTATRDAKPDPTTPPPRTKPAKASPRTRTQSPMRDAPYPYSQSPLAAQIGGICVPGTSFLPPFARQANLTVFPIAFSDQCVARSPRSQAGEMQNVVEGREYHYQQPNREADAEPDLLGTIRQCTAANCLDCIEQKVSAIEQRDREEVQQPDRD